ncbi:hypothetical protein [Streptomyces sp. NPDC002057]|uniref:hypothetical protein n=1 Tax=Streptomyces sp. NPDC002057 TaxID=3154664 RepID=UPI003320236C
MANEPVNPSIQTKYAEQLAADLATNQSQQAELSVRLSQLQEEEKWLITTLQSLPTVGGGKPVSNTVPAGAGAPETAVPQPRAAKPASTAAPAKRTPARKATKAKPAAKKAPVVETSAKEAPAPVAPVAQPVAVEKAPAAKKTAVRKTAAAATKKNVKSTGPTLGELLKVLLSQQPGEPKKVSEISTELKAAHPERATSDQVVRNTLERLVAKDGLDKDTRQGIALYSWPTPQTAAVTAQVKEEPAEVAASAV